MELIFFTSVTMLCILLSTLLTPACAYSLHTQVPPSTELAAKREVQASQLHALPRKLLLAEIEATVVGKEIQDSAPNHKKQQKQNVFAAGTKPLIHEEEEEGAEVHKSSNSGTWQQWRESDDDDDTSAFFTMDYSKVRRRRPIHNKSLKPNGVKVTTATTTTP